MGISFVFKSEKGKIIERLGYYGIEEIPYLLINSGKEKIRGYTGNLTKEKIIELDNEIGIDVMGLYLFHNYSNEIRLSFDAVHALKEQIGANVLELNDLQAKELLKGRDIALSREEFEKLRQKGEKTGFKILKNNEEFIGTGKLTEEGRIVNYMPKERRLR